MNFKRWLAALGAAVALVSTPAQAGYYSSIYAFGDSLSDDGNSLTISVPAQRPPVASDGPVAVQYLATAFGIPLYGYAVGGAMSGTLNADYLPTDPAAPLHPLLNTGVLTQVATFIGSLNGNRADSSALYVVSGGANDVLVDASDPVQLGIDIATNLSIAVASLYAEGARHFLLPLLPDIGLSPFALSLPDPTAATLSGLGELLNVALADAYAMLLQALPDASFTIFDTASAQRAVTSDLAGHNLTDGTTPCRLSAVADACKTSFFWDELHPTTAASALLARDIQAALPEPGSLLLVGVGLLVATARRRHARVGSQEALVA